MAERHVGLDIPEEVLHQAFIGSMSRNRARNIISKLVSMFDAEALVEVDGFREGNDGCIEMSITGDYCLIPFRDSSGAISAIQALPVSSGENAGEDAGEDAGESGAQLDTGREIVWCGEPGDHLYLPAGEPSKMEVIVTSTIESLRLCACGVRAAAIREVGAYKPAPGKDTLPQLEGVNLDGRGVLYAPMLGDPPSRRTVADAPNAMRALVGAAGGVPLMIAEDPDGKPIGEYLLNQPILERREAFENLLAEAIPVDTGNSSTKEPDGGNGEHGPGGSEPKADGGTKPGPVIVPSPDKPPLLPPRVRDMPLTEPEVATLTKSWLACILILLLTLMLWRLPAWLIHYTKAYLGTPVAGREIHLVPLAESWLAALGSAVAAAMWSALPAALLWGAAAGALLCLVMALILMRRRALYRLIVTGDTPKKRWWTPWRE